MKVQLALYLILFVMIVHLPSCDENKRYAGRRGLLTLLLTSKHNGVNSKPIRAFLKFNTQSFPGIDASNYDLSIPCRENTNFIEMKNVNCGNYYIYMVAIDTATTDTVKGGTAFTTDMAKGTVEVLIPVND